MEWAEPIKIRAPRGSTKTKISLLNARIPSRLGTKSLRDWLRLKKIVLFVDGGIWLCFTGSKNQLDILIFKASSDCTIDYLDYLSQNQVF